MPPFPETQRSCGPSACSRTEFVSASVSGIVFVDSSKVRFLVRFDFALWCERSKTIDPSIKTDVDSYSNGVTILLPPNAQV